MHSGRISYYFTISCNRLKKPVHVGLLLRRINMRFFKLENCSYTVHLMEKSNHRSNTSGKRRKSKGGEPY